MLKNRLLTAFIGLPLLLSIIIFAPPAVLALFFSLGIFISVYEASKILIPATLAKLSLSNKEEVEYLGSKIKHIIFFNVILGLTLFFTMVNTNKVKAPIIIFSGLVFSWIGTLFLAASADAIMALVLANTLSLLYGSLFWFVLWQLRFMSAEYLNIIFLLAIVFSSDSGAYFAGRFFGKHKLAPHLSPKKTVEGLIGGVIAGVAGGLILNWLVDWRISSHIWLVVITCIIASLMGVLGDLFESALKRYSEVKDSGAILPGHGGLLDRIDALIFAAPLVWYMLTIIQN